MNRINEKPYYGIFEIVGLSIKTTKEKNKYIFNDALILNGKELKLFFTLRNKSIIEDDRNELWMYKNENTYLLIEHFTNEKDKIYNRAKQIISFLSFVTLVISNFRECISFTSEIYEHSHFSFNIIDSTGKHRLINSQYAFGLNIKVASIITTRINLKKIINNTYFYNLFYLIDNNKSNYNYLIDSLVNFYITFNNLNTSFNYLGSVVSLEMLLKGDGKYEDIKNRLKILLSEKVYEFYNSLITFGNMKDKDIFQIRNDYVHSGKEINSSNALKSLMFTSIVIIATSNLIKINQYKHQRIMIKYLDECYSKSKFEYFDNTIKIKANEFSENFLSVIFILNYLTPRYKEINDIKKNILEKKNDFKKRVRVLMQYKKLDEKSAYNLVNTNSFELCNTFKSFKEYNEYEYKDVEESVENILSLMKKYTHPLNFHNYNAEATTP